MLKGGLRAEESPETQRVFPLFFYNCLIAYQVQVEPRLRGPNSVNNDSWRVLFFLLALGRERTFSPLFQSSGHFPPPLSWVHNVKKIDVPNTWGKTGWELYVFGRERKEEEEEVGQGHGEKEDEAKCVCVCVACKLWRGRAPQELSVYRAPNFLSPALWRCYQFAYCQLFLSSFPSPHIVELVLAKILNKPF